MRNAAAGCAAVARAMCAGRDGSVIVVCGFGQNGGDGYGVASLLARERAVRVLALGEPLPGTDAEVMRDEARALGVQIEPFRGDERSADAVLIVDALFGTGLDRPLSEGALLAVRWINAQTVRVLSIDMPSGMDADTGAGLPECVRASVTATMVAPKRGFATATESTGRVEVVSIGGPDPAQLPRGKPAGGR